jgi:CspA family cold shock protein
VKWFNTEKGYGFITRDSGAEDLFVHISAVGRSGLTSLSEGDRVIVEITEGRKGLEAARVRLVYIIPSSVQGAGRIGRLLDRASDSTPDSRPSVIVF